MARGITEGVAGSEDYSRTVMTYHCPGGNSSSHWFHTAPWLDFNMIQTWSDYKSIPARIAADYKLTPPKPTGLGEGAYENGNQYKFSVNALAIRQQAYWSYLSGGYHTYGNTDVWNFSSYKGEAFQDWKLVLHSPGATHLGVLRKILGSLEWWRLVPDPSVFAGETTDRGAALRARRRDSRLPEQPGRRLRPHGQDHRFRSRPGHLDRRLHRRSDPGGDVSQPRERPPSRSPPAGRMPCCSSSPPIGSTPATPSGGQVQKVFPRRSCVLARRW